VRSWVMDEWGSPQEAAAIVGISRQGFMKQIGELQRLGLAEKMGHRWAVRLDGLKENYNRHVAPRIDSPRFREWW
jgi:hypothetical protein